ncbi:MAG: enoyl-CoA hydratase/isomerase family protein [Bacteroidota bacterium]
MTSSYQTIIIEQVDKVGVLRFNRPDQLNAMNRLMMDEIIAGIESINKDPHLRVGVLTGNGRAFMAGADIKEYAQQTPEQFQAFQKQGEQLYASLEYASKPWIAAINGFALGGGFEIPLACDLILASDQAKMGLPEVFLNLIPGGGGTQRLIQKIGINRVKEMLFTGGQYDAQTLFNWGLVNRVFEASNFEEASLAFAAKLTRRPPEAISQLKRLAHLSLSAQSFEQRIMEEGKTVAELFYSESAQKAIQKFIDKN